MECESKLVIVVRTVLYMYGLYRSTAYDLPKYFSKMIAVDAFSNRHEKSRSDQDRICMRGPDASDHPETGAREPV